MEETKLSKLMQSEREAQGISQQTLATRARVSISLISKLEQGASISSRIDLIKMILEDGLGFSVQIRCAKKGEGWDEFKVLDTE